MCLFGQITYLCCPNVVSHHLGLQLPRFEYVMSKFLDQIIMYGPMAKTKVNIVWWWFCCLTPMPIKTCSFRFSSLFYLFMVPFRICLALPKVPSPWQVPKDLSHWPKRLQRWSRVPSPRPERKALVCETMVCRGGTIRHGPIVTSLVTKCNSNRTHPGMLEKNAWN